MSNQRDANYEHAKRIMQEHEYTLNEEQNVLARQVRAEAWYFQQVHTPGEDLHSARRADMFHRTNYDSLSKDEQKLAKQKHKEEIAKNTFVNEEDLHTTMMDHVMESKVKVGKREITQRQLFTEVTQQNDYSHMQQMDPLLRNRAATLYMIEHRDEFAGEYPALIVAEIKKKGLSAMMNPLMRVGISCAINSPYSSEQEKEKFRQIDALLNKEIMMATITRTKRPGSADDNIPQKAWDDNLQAQEFMFKTMLACHLGKLKKVDGGTSSNWSGPVANAFAHCSRVMITLPGEQKGYHSSQNQANMFKSFHGLAGFKRRAAATHSMELKKKGGTAAVEKKGLSLRHQRGKNVAIGGLGNGGVSGRTLLNDGSCGHLFMHFVEGGKQEHAGMLLGFESDAYGVMNQTGHVHDIKATGEFQSSFGGQRCDEVGDKYGGRVVDLSGCDVVTFTLIMQNAGEAFKRLAAAPTHMVNGVTLEDLTEKVCGDLTSNEEKLKEILVDIFRVSKGLQLEPNHALNTLYRRN